MMPNRSLGRKRKSFVQSQHEQQESTTKRQKKTSPRTDKDISGNGSGDHQFSKVEADLSGERNINHKTFGKRPEALPDCLDWEGRFVAVLAPTPDVPANAERSRTDNCLQWETNYQSFARDEPRQLWHANKKSEAEAFVMALMSNIQSRRLIEDLRTKIQNCGQAIKTMQEGKGGVDDLLASVRILRNDKSPVAIGQMASQRAKLQRFELALSNRQLEENKLVKLLQDRQRNQRSLDERLLTFDIGMEYGISSPIHALTASFFVKLEEFREMAAIARTAELGLMTLDEEWMAAENELEAVWTTEAMVRIQKDDQGALAKHVHSVASVPAPPAESKWYELVSRRDDLTLKLSQARKSLTEVADALCSTAECSFVAKGILSPNGNSVRDVRRASAQSGERQRICCTPIAPVPTDADKDTHRKTARASIELQKKLKALLRAELNAASAEHLRCKRALGNIDSGSIPRHMGASDLNTVKEQSKRYFLEKRRRYEELSQAEGAYRDVLRRAQEACLDGVAAKSEGFSSHASDGYLASEVRVGIQKTDFLAIGSWILGAVEAKAPGFRLEGPQSATDEDAFAIVVSDSDVYDIESLAFGESISTAGEGRSKLLIDQENAKWRPNGDGFRARR
ncbi:hypothetical protein KC338_g3430 [Hortaea werneckii]|nr:hypothetical protein KC338_g3430 [Hortaea werneckii]KAI7354576.1 hypothetical protein KC320_g3362 [Hortaea werneckii]